MNKSILITAAVTAGVSVLAYMLSKKNNVKKMKAQPVNGRSHHLTDVFSNAKR